MDKLRTQTLGDLDIDFKSHLRRRGGGSDLLMQEKLLEISKSWDTSRSASLTRVCHDHRKQ